MSTPPRLHFVAGLPRSGSTLLMNLLGQNPAHHVTPTSGLIELFVTVKNRWTEFIEFKAEGLETAKPRVLGSLRGILHGHFEQELQDGNTVFDKSRGWLQYIEPLEETLGRKVKIIVTVRDVRAIVASFEKIYRSRSIDYREALGDSFFNCQTIEGRTRELLSPKSVLGLSIARLRDALARGVGDRLVIVPYAALTCEPTATSALLHQALELPAFAYDPEDVRQTTYEDDAVHGMDLHRIRSKIEPPAKVPWEGVLPDALSAELAAKYSDFNRLSVWRPPSSNLEGSGASQLESAVGRRQPSAAGVQQSAPASACRNG